MRTSTGLQPDFGYLWFTGKFEWCHGSNGRRLRRCQGAGTNVAELSVLGTICGKRIRFHRTFKGWKKLCQQWVKVTKGAVIWQAQLDEVRTREYQRERSLPLYESEGKEFPVRKNYNKASYFYFLFCFTGAPEPRAASLPHIWLHRAPFDNVPIPWPPIAGLP